MFQMMKSRLRKFKLLAWSCISVKSWNKNLNPNLSCLLSPCSYPLFHQVSEKQGLPRISTNSEFSNSFFYSETQDTDC